MLKYLLSDEESLWRYCNGECPDLSAIKRRMIKCARKMRFQTTDSHFRLETQIAFKNINSLSKVFTVGLVEIAEMHIDKSENRLLVKGNMQNKYQELLPFIPPLILQAAKIFSNFPLKVPYNDYYSTYILPNNRFTSILSPKIAVLESILENNKGLIDLHIHLNGSMETDIVWQDHLFSPELARDSMKSALKKEKVWEQVEQESHLFDADKYFHLLRTARRIRKTFYEFLSSSPEKNIRKLSAIEIIRSVIEEPKDQSSDYRHPFLSLITDDISYQYTMSIECLMFVWVLDELKTSGNEALACLLHFYLLILGLTNRLLVQQTHQHGFEQFQKHTLNKLRDKSEEQYVSRFLQLHGNDLNFLRFLEGRFAPKREDNELRRQISEIYDGWAKLKLQAKLESEVKLGPVINPTLKLIAHFIKEPDLKPDDYIRHKLLRVSLASRAQVISLLLKNHIEYRENIVGLDAASSEFDAPPEVFAPAFRVIKRESIARRTYHAGEDFHHLISGLRAIYEAITFCRLTTYDRVGHAVATGISAKKWSKAIGDYILIPKGEYLDNLIFSRFLIKSSPITKLLPIISDLESKASELIVEIYGNGYTVDEYESAWHMRDICPRHAFASDEKAAGQLKLFNQDEWDFITDRNIKKDSNGFLLFKKYHELHYRKRAEEVIEVMTEGLVDRKSMKMLQLAILKMMADKKIIIETLPTSNVRIGIHRDFSTYHIERWLRWKEQSHLIPDIVVGSDDTGIFATNIYNEYANIYCFLKKSNGWTDTKKDKLLTQLNIDSDQFKFIGPV